MADSQELISAYFDGVLTDQQFAELAAWISKDSANMAEFVRASWIHSSLRDSLQSDDLGGLMHKASAGDSETELLASTEDILSMLGEDATQQDVEKPSQAQQIRQTEEPQQSRARHPVPIAIPRNLVYPTVVSFAAVAIFCFVAFCVVSILNMAREPVFLAKIVATEMPVWNDGSAKDMPPETDLRLGQVLDIEAGLVEIEFGDGARVILEGPARFEIRSRDAGDLQLGKLVARVPVKAHGFRIHTPGMQIVDLGTEFAVSVNQQQVAYLHVFEGQVSAAALDAQGKTVRQQTVLADEAVYLRPKTSAIEPTSAAVSHYFARHLSDAVRSREKDIPMPRYSTGVGLAAGDADPNWRIVAAENVPGFVPRQAIVAPPRSAYVSSDPRLSQWVSPAADYARLPAGAQYTFRMKWTIADVHPDRLHGSFRADDLVAAIRVNGVAVSVPKHKSGSQGPSRFSIDGRHLKPGQNVIEFDVRNAGKRDGFADKETPLALWVRWKGGG